MTNPPTDEIERVALLPCPFCGGEAKRITIGDDEPNNAGGDVICCTRCQASSHVEFGYKENLVSHWNTRRESEALQEALEPFANIARQIRKAAPDNRWLEQVLFYAGSDDDPTKWSLTGQAFDKARAALTNTPTVVGDGE